MEMATDGPCTPYDGGCCCSSSSSSSVLLRVVGAVASLFSGRSPDVASKDAPESSGFFPSAEVFFFRAGAGASLSAAVVPASPWEVRGGGGVGFCRSGSGSSSSFPSAVLVLEPPLFSPPRPLETPSGKEAGALEAEEEDEEELRGCTAAAAGGDGGERGAGREPLPAEVVAIADDSSDGLVMDDSISSSRANFCRRARRRSDRSSRDDNPGEWCWCWCWSGWRGSGGDGDDDDDDDAAVAASSAPPRSVEAGADGGDAEPPPALTPATTLPSKGKGEDSCRFLQSRANTRASRSQLPMLPPPPPLLLLLLLLPTAPAWPRLMSPPPSFSSSSASTSRFGRGGEGRVS